MRDIELIKSTIYTTIDGYNRIQLKQELDPKVSCFHIFCAYCIQNFGIGKQRYLNNSYEFLLKNKGFYISFLIR